MSTRAQTAFVGAGVSVVCCFTLRVRSMNGFCLTHIIVALAIKGLLSTSAVKVFTIMICVQGCVRCALKVMFACAFCR